MLGIRDQRPRVRSGRALGPSPPCTPAKHRLINSWTKDRLGEVGDG